MNRILALLDGSAYAASVCHHAGWIAGLLGAGVDAMHVLDRPAPGGTADLSGTLQLGARSALLADLSALDRQRATLAQAGGHALLEDAQALLAQDGVTEVKLHLRKGDLLDAVRTAEAETRAIVIGKRGMGADFATGHLGSNLERIIRATTVPVLVAARSFQPIRSVLVAYDGSASADAAIRRMAASPVFEGLDVTTVCVGSDVARAKDHADRAAGQLQAAGLSASARTATGEPETALQDMVATEGFDLLVMGAHGHSRIRSLIIGSTTTALIRAVRIPVLLYR